MSERRLASPCEVVQMAELLLSTEIVLSFLTALLFAFRLLAAFEGTHSTSLFPSQVDRVYLISLLPFHLTVYMIYRDCCKANAVFTSHGFIVNDTTSHD